MGPTPAEPRRIAFLGFGLIAGSMALALRARGAAPAIAAWSPTGRGPEAGRARGVVDTVGRGQNECVEGAELVVLAGPPIAVLGTLRDVPGPFGRAVGTATITDVASTKAAILRTADGSGARFVGGHPMAGRESSGFEAATADLFVDRPWVVVPGAAATALDIERVEWLATAVGGRPVRMTGEAHDAAVAAISHLPLVVAAALVEAVLGGDDWAVARTLAATSWRDMTRTARGDPEMGAGILATNADEVAARLRDLRAAVDRWLEVLQPGGEARPDPDVLRARLAAARAGLEDAARLSE